MVELFTIIWVLSGLIGWWRVVRYDYGYLDGLGVVMIIPCIWLGVFTLLLSFPNFINFIEKD